MVGLIDQTDLFFIINGALSAGEDRLPPSKTAKPYSRRTTTAPVLVATAIRPALAASW